VSSQAVSSPRDCKTSASHPCWSGLAICRAHANGSGPLSQRRGLAAPGRSCQASAIMPDPLERGGGIADASPGDD
jgi:hypothetical protein